MHTAEQLAALEQHGLRPTLDGEYHVRLAKQAYVRGTIEIDEFERRVERALEGYAVLADDVPLFDRTVTVMARGLEQVRLCY